MKTRLECPYCDQEINVEHDNISEGQSLTCPKCNERFNVYTIYKSFYEDIPFTKKMADIHIKLVKNKFEVRGPADDVAKINDFFERNNFGRLFQEIVADTVIYGTSFIETGPSDDTVTRHDPAVCEVYTEWREEPPRKSLFQVAGVVSMDGRRIDPSKIILFTHGSSSMPFGMSIYGFWFHTIYPLRIASTAQLNASLLEGAGLSKKGTAASLKKLRDFFERQAATGAGLPLTLLKEERPPEFALAYLRLNTKLRRDHIVSTMERELFPYILNKPWQIKEYPEFHIQGHDYRYHEY